MAPADEQRSSKTLRILHLVPSFHPAAYFGGPIVSVYALCNHLAMLPGIALRVLTTDTSGPRSRDRLGETERQQAAFAGYEVTFHRKLLGADFSPGLLMALYKAMSWADVVHVTAVYSSPTLPALLLARLHGKPIVWSPRGALQRWTATRRWRAKAAWDAAANGLLDPRRSILHATSNEEAEESARRIPNARPVVIENGVEVPSSLPDREWRPGGLMRILYLGRLDPKKGIDNLLQSIAGIAGFPLLLRICGGGSPEYERQLAALCRQLGLENHVTFVGPVLGEAKSAEFLRADLCVVPSHTENFGMVVAESLAHGTPVIASRGTPWQEIERRGAGKWVPNDPQSLAAAISEMRRADLDAMGAAGREWMLNAFSWPAIASRMLTVYRGLAKMGSSPSPESRQ